MTVLPYLVPDSELETRVMSWPERARAITITDDASYESAGAVVNDIKALRREIDESYDPIIQSTNESHKKALAQKRRYETPLVEAEAIIKRGLSAYHSEQERRAADERRRLEDLRRKEEEDLRLQEALAAEDAGDSVAAEEILSAPVVVAPIRVPVAKPSGITYRETWSGEVTDLLALARFIVANPQFLNLIVPNTTAVNNVARTMKGAANIPGLRVYAQTTVAAGGRKV